MDYRQAIDLAKQGSEEGFQFLYESTYQSKYYLALKYMKDEQEAQDLLQDAYLKAFSKLDQLEKPEAFPSWLGTIVGNLAKNKLQKKNPLLFSDIAANDEDEPFAYEIEDENGDYQPELSYSKQETQQLVHEMINALSEEQRVCILMYEIEGIPIKEIAAALDCSENTVKSRLNYGRKNLKKKAEELQKKGYKLYGLAPVPLLLFLLRREKAFLSGDGKWAAAQSQAAKRIFPHTEAGNAAGAGAPAAALEGGKAVASGAAKAAFFHTVAGKITAVLVSLAVAGGVFGTAYSIANRDEAPAQEPGTEASAEEGPEASPAVQASEPEASQEPAEPEEPEVREMTESDYEELIAGNLTKGELEYVLAYGPDEIPEQGFEPIDYVYLLNQLCQGTQTGLIEDYGPDSQYRSQYSLEDVNRLFSSFTDFQFAEGSYEGNVSVEGDAVCFFPATLNFTAEAEITAAQYTDDEMNLYFTYHRSLYDEGALTETRSDKKAVLRPTAEGEYRIVKIEAAEEGEPAQEPSGEGSAAKETGGQQVDEIYGAVLNAVKEQEEGYAFTDSWDYTGSIKYFFQDMDGDGIEELIVGAEYSMGAFMGMDCRFYSCRETGGGYALTQIQGAEVVQTLCVPKDGNGLLSLSLSRGTGMYDCSRISIEDNAVQSNDLPEYQFRLGGAEEEQFWAENPPVQWIDLV